MTITTFSSREFNQDTGKAKKAALQGPVFITDRGKPSFVLMTVEEFGKISSTQCNIADLLYMLGAEDVDFDVPKLANDFLRPADFS
jgi:prevent-host-death family protein